MQILGEARIVPKEFSNIIALVKFLLQSFTGFIIFCRFFLCFYFVKFFVFFCQIFALFYKK